VRRTTSDIEPTSVSPPKEYSSSKEERRSRRASSSYDTVTYEVELKLVENVGSGWFGTVWKAEWKTIICAVKVLPREKFTDSQVQRFFDEGNKLKMLTPHPHIVRYRGICADPLCNAVDFCEAGSLQALLHEDVISLSISDCIDLMLDISKGMAFLVRENIIHRNLASRNVMLIPKEKTGEDGCAFTAKVSDFGMRTLLEDRTPKEYSQIGNIKWMPPETLERNFFNSKSDVWSFAITCIEILTRDEPFPDLTNDEFMNSADELQKTITSQIPTGIPNQLILLLKECFMLENDPRPDFAYICYQLESLKKYMDLKNLKKVTSTAYLQKLASSENVTPS